MHFDADYDDAHDAYDDEGDVFDHYAQAEEEDAHLFSTEEGADQQDPRLEDLRRREETISDRIYALMEALVGAEVVAEYDAVDVIRGAMLDLPTTPQIEALRERLSDVLRDLYTGKRRVRCHHNRKSKMHRAEAEEGEQEEGEEEEGGDEEEGGE